MLDINLCPAYYEGHDHGQGAGRGHRDPDNSDTGMRLTPARHLPLNRAKSR